MKVLEFTRQYLLARDLSTDYSNSFLHRVRSLVEFSGKNLLLGDLNDVLVNGWLAALQESGEFAPKTIREYRGAVLSLWNEAYSMRLVESRAERIRAVKLPQTVPTAWTLDELATLVATAEKMPGKISKSPIPRKVFFPVFVHFLYETGLRLSDALDAKVECLWGRNITVTQSKTGKVITRAISQVTLAGLEDIQEHVNSEYLFPWPARVDSIHRQFKKLVAASGIRQGTTRYLRRSGASYCEKDNPGASRKYLGHQSSQALADRHYNDPRIVEATPVIPPPIPQKM